MIPARCRYEVFLADAARFENEDRELQAMVEKDVTWEQVERSQNPGLFEPPAFGSPTGDQPERFRHPVKGVPDAIAAAIRDAAMCHVITTAAKDPRDADYLFSAIMLASEIATARRGVVVDRTADIGYTAEYFFRLRGGLAVREAVVVHEDAGPGEVRLWTSGMVKFGQSDFLIESFPQKQVEMGRRLLWDNLCHYSAYHSSLEPGQNMQYMGGDPAAKFFFELTGDGYLRVSDCHADEKKPTPGLRKFVEMALPMFQAEDDREPMEADKTKETGD
ncbi:MAG: hypothetical protein ABIJ56_00560 [Pseudomonadota bacterium]